MAGRRTATRGKKSRDRRKAVAQQNTEARAKRSTTQQLSRLDKAGHQALRERNRLLGGTNG